MLRTAKPKAARFYMSQTEKANAFSLKVFAPLFSKKRAHPL